MYRQERTRYNAVQKGLRITASAILRGRVSVSHEGIEHVPAEGPFILAARHYHHLFDGAVLYNVVQRPLQVFVALDWAPNAIVRSLMEGLCRAAEWPVGLRSIQYADGKSAYHTSERLVYLRRAFRDVAAHLRNGRGVVFFPEGAPVVDPHQGVGVSNLFAPGLCVAIEMAQKNGTVIPIVPVGLVYRVTTNGYHVSMRCGQALIHRTKRERITTMELLSHAVRKLCAAPHE